MPSDTEQPDLYAIMHLAPGCTDEDVRNQWRHFARVFHPDVHPGDTWFEEEFKKIEQAYEVLGHPDRRAAYDRERAISHLRSNSAVHPTPSESVLYDSYCVPDETASLLQRRRVRLVSAGALCVLILMTISIIRALRGAHPEVPANAQIIEGGAVVGPSSFAPSQDPAIRAQQSAFQTRLNAVLPRINQLTAQTEQILALMAQQDQSFSHTQPVVALAVDRQKDEAALNADADELHFQISEIEQQIGLMGMPRGADQDTIREDLQLLERPQQPILADIRAAQADLAVKTASNPSTSSH
ncbi:MAG TPA: J domain-containing protein [Capsulimonadaceae bacterium]|nr:J domain-containing protein [Capsulimonadaceae bacterium]